MVARGHGFTLLNQRPVHDLTYYDGGRLVVIELEEEAGRLDIVLASAQPLRTLSRRAQAFVAQCRAVVAAQALDTGDKNTHDQNTGDENTGDEKSRRPYFN